MIKGMGGAYQPGPEDVSGEGYLIAAGGWCAPLEQTYSFDSGPTQEELAAWHNRPVVAVAENEVPTGYTFWIVQTRSPQESRWETDYWDEGRAEYQNREEAQASADRQDWRGGDLKRVIKVTETQTVED